MAKQYLDEDGVKQVWDATKTYVSNQVSGKMDSSAFTASNIVSTLGDTAVKNATKATQDGNGNVIADTYVTLATEQTISASKTFANGATLADGKAIYNHNGVSILTVDGNDTMMGSVGGNAIIRTSGGNVRLFAQDSDGFSNAGGISANTTIDDRTDYVNLISHDSSTVSVGNSNESLTLIGNQTRPYYNSTSTALALSSDIPTYYTHSIRIEINYTNGDFVRAIFQFVASYDSLITDLDILRTVLAERLYSYTTDVNVQTSFPASGKCKNNGTVWDIYTCGLVKSVTNYPIGIECRNENNNYLFVNLQDAKEYSYKTFNDAMFKM